MLLLLHLLLRLLFLGEEGVIVSCSCCCCVSFLLRLPLLVLVRSTRCRGRPPRCPVGGWVGGWVGEKGLGGWVGGQGTYQGVVEEESEVEGLQGSDEGEEGGRVGGWVGGRTYQGRVEGESEVERFKSCDECKEDGGAFGAEEEGGLGFVEHLKEVSVLSHQSTQGGFQTLHIQAETDPSARSTDDVIHHPTGQNGLIGSIQTSQLRRNVFGHGVVLSRVVHEGGVAACVGMGRGGGGGGGRGGLVLGRVVAVGQLEAARGRRPDHLPEGEHTCQG